MLLKLLNKRLANSVYKLDLYKLFRFCIWTCAIFCYFFQFYFRNLSKYIVPCIFLYATLELKNIRLFRDKCYNLIFFLWYVFLGFEIFNSLLRGNDINQIVRFLEILTFLPICLFIKDKNFDKEYKILVFFAILKSLILIGIAIYLIYIGSHIAIRNYFRTIQGGDVFLASGYRPKVQLHGNGLLPFVFMLYNSKQVKFNFFSIILFLGILAAGNFAFILCLCGFFLYICYKGICSKINKNGIFTVVFLFCFIISSPLIYKYINKTSQQKSINSNAIRIEQTGFLTDTNYIFGKGLGNNIKAKGTYRAYENNSYFELQRMLSKNLQLLIKPMLILKVLHSKHLVYQHEKFDFQTFL